jgi:hypothetical protein
MSSHLHSTSADWKTIDCPECGVLAEVQPHTELNSTSGRVKHVKVRCLSRHWFLLPAELMASL